MMKCVLLVILFFIQGMIYSAETGTLVFSDDFTTTGLFAENWDFSKGVMPKDGTVRLAGEKVLSIKLRKKMSDDFTVAAHVIPAKFNGSYGHTGLVIDGIHFMINHLGHASTAYRPPAASRSKVNGAFVPGYKFGDPCKISVTRRQNDKMREYLFQINDTLLLTIKDDEMIPTNTIALYSYLAELRISSVSLWALPKGIASPNQALNSSFEYLIDGMPPYFDLATYRWNSWRVSYEEYLKTAVVDGQEKYAGKNSLCLTSNESVSQPGFSTSRIGCEPGKPVTGSVWLKADTPNKQVKIFFKDNKKLQSAWVKVSDQWERHEYTLPAPVKDSISFGVQLCGKGRLWVDCVQVEAGDKATPYKASFLEAVYFGNGKKAVGGKVAKPEDVKVPLIRKAPVVDGDLSDFPKGSKITTFLYKGKYPAAYDTTAWIACDKENLYVAFLCAVPENASFDQKPLERDSLAIYTPENIELFFDPLSSGKNYYQFALTPANSQADKVCRSSGLVWTWNGKWESAVKFNKKEKCLTYEIAIPLGNFAEPGIRDVWGFNLARGCKASGQSLSLLHIPEVNYHEVSSFPKLIFPPGVLSGARIGFGSVSLSENLSGNVLFNATVQNLTGMPLKDVSLELFESKTEKVFGKKTVNVPVGNSDVHLPVVLPASSNNKEITVRLSKTDRTVITQREFIIPVVKAMTVFSRHHFYMEGDSAEFFGECTLPTKDLRGIATVDGKKFQFHVAPEWKAVIPLRGIASGKHRIEFEVFDKEEKITSASIPVTVQPKRDLPFCRIDRKHRTLEIDGKPALIIAPFLEVGRGFTPEMTRNMVKTFANAGFKYLTCGSFLPDDTATKAFMDEAAKHGIKVVYWNFGAWKQRTEWTPLEFMKKITYPNVIALLILDEPNLYAESKEAETFMRKYQEASPHLPVFMNLTPNGIPNQYAGLTTDIVMIDDYLTSRETRTVGEMLSGAEMVEKAGLLERKPAWFFPAGDNLHNHYRECSFDEQLAQCYGMMIKGCTGLVHFCGLPKWPRNWEALRQVNQEFLELQDIVFSDEKCSDAVSSDKTLAVMTRKYGNRICVIALNPEKSPVNAVLRLPAEFRYADRAEVRFEGRSVPVKDGVIQDVFHGLERHVYVIETGK